MTCPATGPVIRGDEALAAFRRGLTGPQALDLLREAGGRLLVQLPVGVGKTEWILRIIVHALAAGAHDLAIVLVPLRSILEELRRRLPDGLPVKVLHPRPRSRCGPLDTAWLEFERNGCGLLGREELCRGCPRRKGCSWLGQYGPKGLRGARLILGTQQHLVNNPQFIVKLCDDAGAVRPLVLLDESDLLLRSAERVITREQVRTFLAALEQVLAASEEPSREMLTWRHLVELLAEATTPDLQQGDWRFPRADRSWSVAVQRAGRQAAGGAFRYLEYDLRALGRSDPGSRERLPNGDLRYAARFELDGDFIVFSGTTARELVRYRLDPNHRRPPLASPFEGLRFEHPGTRWYNIASMRGAAKYFPGGASSILDFFAEKVAGNIRAGRRTLLIARKKFRRRCADYLARRLRELGVGRVRVVTGGWGQVDLTDPRTLPLINYGISGVNLFEDFDAAYCLSSYYIAASTVAQVLYDIDPTTDRFPLEVRRTTGQPPQRRAHVGLPDDRETILPRLAQCVLDQMEAGAVVQAVGRVRPFTRPREVITFQDGSFPGVQNVIHFDSFAQARALFGIRTRRRADFEVRATQALRLKALGLSNRRIAEELGVSRATIKRYLRGGRGHEMSE